MVGDRAPLAIEKDGYRLQLNRNGGHAYLSLGGKFAGCCMILDRAEIARVRARLAEIEAELDLGQ